MRRHKFRTASFSISSENLLRIKTTTQSNTFWDRSSNRAAQAAKTLKQTYTVAYIAHTPLEPRAAVAEWKDGKLTVWTGTQRPFAVGEELADSFSSSAERRAGNCA